MGMSHGEKMLCSCIYIYIHTYDMSIIKGSLVEKLPSYGDLKM